MQYFYYNAWGKCPKHHLEHNHTMLCHYYTGGTCRTVYMQNGTKALIMTSRRTKKTAGYILSLSNPELCMGLHWCFMMKPQMSTKAEGRSRWVEGRTLQLWARIEKLRWNPHTLNMWHANKNIESFDFKGLKSQQRSDEVANSNCYHAPSLKNTNKCLGIKTKSI